MALDTHITTTTAGALASAVRPGDDGYDAACSSFNPLVDQRPAAVASPADAAELSALVVGARRAGLRVAIRGGGHNAGPQGDLEDSLLIRTERMDSVAVDPAARIARVGAGVRWEAVVDAAAPHGLAALHGSSPTVGVVGYSLGGGLGWLARRHGLQVNRITAAEVVLADGERVRTDATHEPELFWALRGAGANVGIVTALEFELLPVSVVHSGWLAWDWSESERVLSRFAEWAVAAPESVTASARILQLPPLPELPEPIRGRQLVVIDGAVLGGDEEAARVLAPLRELRPEIDTFAGGPVATLKRLHGDPEQPMPATSDTAMLGSLPEAAVRAFVEAAGPESGSMLAVAELRQLGGAVARPVPGGGAVSSFDGQFLAFCVGVVPTPELAPVIDAQARGVIGALSPWAAGRPYLNFAESPCETARGFADPERVRAIRDAVDPTGVLRPNHLI